MIVNGVTLPDIPAEVLAQYPYVVIVSQDYLEATGPIGYLMFATKSEILYASAEAFGGANATINALSTGYEVYSCFSDGTSYPDEWTRMDDQCSETDMFSNPIGEYVINANATVEFAIVWANHDIKEVTGFDPETGGFLFGETYFPNSEAPKPTRVSIGRSLVDGYAKEVQRLTGTTEQMNAIQIREKLSTVKAAIKIGDTVLPPIPEDVLAEFPYAMIGLNSDYNMYLLGVSDTPFAYLPAELTTTGNAFITTVGFRHKFYAYDGSAWVFQNENSTERIYQELNETIGVCWANDDICTITSRTDAQGEITVGTEVYFSERQNFNGVWLPKVPADMLAEYPYALITQEQGATVYALIMCTEKLFYLPPGAITGATSSTEMVATLGAAKIMNVAWPLNAWEFLQEAGPMEGFIQLAQHRSIIWTNHDVKEAIGLNETGTEFIFGDLYFPPLPAIDTDRVSIGYDLCDGIVEEVQRLSGDQDKMDALHAYWKLTTVPVIVTGPGEIIINGVKLPPIPAELLAEEPCAVIIHDPTDAAPDEYTLYTTKGEIGYLPPSIAGSSTYGALVSSQLGHTLYIATPNSTEWTFSKRSDSNYLFGIIPSARPDWANLDIYEITSLDANTGAYTKGDIWFAKTV